MSHKLETEDTREGKWYSGTVISYNPATKHEVSYDGGDEHCQFHVLLDFLTGDLRSSHNNIDMFSLLLYIMH